MKEGNRIKEAIQVCVSLSDEKTMQRELQSMMEVCNELEKGRGRKPQDVMMTIITQDEEKLIKTERGNITVIPLWKWLIGK